MKPQQLTVVAGVLLILSVLLVITGRPQSVSAPVKPPDRTITVIGEGEVRPKPNRAIVSLGILTHGASASEVEASLLASVARVRLALIDIGANNADIETGHAELAPVTFQNYIGVQQITGFQSRVRMTAATSNLAKVQAMVDSALAAGATSLESITYTLLDPEEAVRSATAAALENARLRAKALVKVTGDSVGEVLSVEVLDAPVHPQAGNSTGGLIYRVRVRATYEQG